MEWCGTDSIVLYWEQLKLLLMVGPYGDWIKYPYEDSGKLRYILLTNF